MHEEPATYESARALRSTESLPDKIHWDDDASFRDQPYRQLHHQQGLVGLFRVRLLEAADLKRSYWSALALGPVKHLGLSKAHGDVSSACSFSLTFCDAYSSDKEGRRPLMQRNSQGNDWDRKPAAKDNNTKQRKQQQAPVVSTVVPENNNPVWENCQFEFPLVKGAMPEDGMRIHLQVQVDEDATALESIIPGIPSGGTRTLGIGHWDVTDLCLGETPGGQVLPGVRDAWIPISLPDEENSKEPQEHRKFHYQDPLAPPEKKDPSSLDKSKNQPNKTTGRVRVLISYEPVGLEPQPRDIVALEAFARRDPRSSSCPPVLPPLMPLTVVDRRGSYILCEYRLPDMSSNARSRRHRKACIRLHRNAVFVIERQNLVDAAHNLALLPVDVVMSTPLGQAAARVLAPVAAAGQELAMPALLSAKLLWMAGRTTTLAGLSGVQALGSTLLHEGTSSLTASHRKNQGSQNNTANVQPSNRSNNQRHPSRQEGLAPFVQL